MCFAVVLVEHLTTDEGFVVFVVVGGSVWLAPPIVLAGIVVAFRCGNPDLMDDLWLAEDATDIVDGIVLGFREVGNCFGMFDVRHLLEGLTLNERDSDFDGFGLIFDDDELT